MGERCRPPVATYLLLWALVGAGPVTADIVLSEPSSDVYYTLAATAQNEVKIGVDSLVVGNVHSNDKVTVEEGTTVDGDVSTTGDVILKGSVTGQILETAPAKPLPTLLSLSEARSLADRVFSGDRDFVDETIDDVVFVEGTARLVGTIRGRGTIFASTDVVLETVSPGSGPDLLDPDARLSLIAFQDVKVLENRSLRGALYAAFNVILEKGVSFEGTLVAGDQADIKEQTRIEFLNLDEEPPEATLVAPVEGSFVPTATPSIELAFLDDLSGVDPDRVTLRVDGVDRTAESEITGDGAFLTPGSALPEGVRTLEVLLVDHSGRQSSSIFGFGVDTIPPVVELTSPASDVFNDLIPIVAASLSDATSGLRAESFRIALDGTDLAGCFVESGLVECQPNPLSLGAHNVVIQIEDVAGNEAISTRSFTIREDRTPPTVAIETPLSEALIPSKEIEVAGSVMDDHGIASVEVDGEPAILVDETFRAQTRLDEGRNTIVVTATDFVGQRGVATVTVTVDTQPPGIVVETPPDPSVTNADRLLVAGLANDRNGVESVSVAWAPATLLDARFEATVDLPEEGLNVIPVEAVDQAGNRRISSLAVTRFTVPEIRITSPPDASVVTSDTVAVQGTLSEGDSVRVNDVEATVSGDSFSAVVPVEEGLNVLSATATSSNGRQATTKRTVFLDRIPPTLVIESPQQGAVIRGDRVTVRGLVDDFLPGVTEVSPVTVGVNGVPAQIANGAFLVPAVSLVPGENTLVVTAEDAVGNRNEVALDVFAQAVQGPAIELHAGNFQVGSVGDRLPEPLVVRLTDVVGNPVAGEPVFFKLIRSDGSLRLPGDVVQARQLVGVTDAQGLARVELTLGSRAGPGSHRVSAAVSGFGPPVIFTASATEGSPAMLVVDEGNQQVGVAGVALPDPFVAVVTDAGANRLQGVPVGFRVVRGRGVFEESGLPVVEVLSDGRGRAAARLVTDPAAGVASNVVEAFLPQHPEVSVANFVASTLVAGRAEDTVVQGLVLDNTDRPVPGVTVHIEGSSLSSVTDERGFFRIPGAPVGTILLLVDGSTAERPGVWPQLEFRLTTVAGHNNDVGFPIHLLPLNLDEGAFVSETEGGLLTLERVPGFSLEIEPGSATFPDGSRSGLVSVTVVHSDKVPMVPNFGQQPRFVVTIQPASTIFDPPARLTLPNVDGLAPGDSIEIYSFDHDLERFVSVGLATVSDDGAVLVSNPGSGVRKAGWHCGGDPASSGTPFKCPECQKCDGNDCVPDPEQDGNICEGDFCRECKNGSCVPTDAEVMIDEPPDNPNPSDDDFDTNFSFLSTDTIEAKASLDEGGDPEEIEWEVTAEEGDIKNEEPADRKGPIFQFQPDPPEHPDYVRGRNCANPGNGSCDRSDPLSYKIKATYCESEDEHTITQDQLDIIRQEYVNHGLNVPGRDEFEIPTAEDNFSVAEIIGRNSYSVVLGTPGELAQAVRDEFNSRIRDDEQVIPVGTMGLASDAVVVAPGAEIERIGALLDTTPCNGATSAECDDTVVENTIVAGPNGIAETVAENEVTNVPLEINSAWRNPERNEAVGGILNSRHQFGNAVDLDIFGPAEGKTMQQLFCILETAGDAVATGIAEDFGVQVLCDDEDVTHVHVQQ